MEYRDFLESKRLVQKPCGFEPRNLNGHLFDFQRDIVSWACRKGRAAIFADCGMGKTIMQLSWAQQVFEHRGGLFSSLLLWPSLRRHAVKVGCSASR